MSTAVSSLLGWLEPAMALPFPAGLRGVPDRAGPRSLAFAGSSPRELRRLFRVLCARHLPAARAADAFPGVLFLFRDVSARSPRRERLPNTARLSALSVSHALDGLLLLVPSGPVSSRSRA
jgi:hypothetical protein